MSLCICLILLLGAVMLSAASQANPGPGTDDDLSEDKKQTTKMLGKNIHKEIAGSLKDLKASL